MLKLFKLIVYPYAYEYLFHAVVKSAFFMQWSNHDQQHKHPHPHTVQLHRTVF